jgi:hypothetical protein
MILVSPIPTPADRTVYPSFRRRINNTPRDYRHVLDDFATRAVAADSSSPGNRLDGAISIPRHIL